MNKEIIDEVEFPDDIISFLKIKFPKAYTDQEKSVLKQIECLAEEKKDLKEMMSKKRDQEKIKLMPINVAALEEAKEKAIKLVQDGTLNLSSRAKLLDIDDSLFGDSDQLNIDTNTKSKVRSHSGKSKHDSKSTSKSKISFISAGYAFAESGTDNNSEIGPKRQSSVVESSPLKRIRHISNSSSDSENEDRRSKVNNSASHLQKSEHLRFCGHNLSAEFVRKIVEPFGNITFIEMESRTDGKTPNVIVTMENLDMAVAVQNGLDSKFMEGRVINVHFRRDGGGFSGRRPYRRRRGRGGGGDQFRSRDRFSFPRNNSFQPPDTETSLPSHFYSHSADIDERNKRRPNWTGHDDSAVHNDESLGPVAPASSSPKLEIDRGLVVYDGLPEYDDDE